MVHTVTLGAMHLAAYMGAKNVFLCGIDCGWVDGRLYYNGYDMSQTIASMGKEEFEKYMESWLMRSEHLIMRMRTRLKEVYDCNTYSLVPFVGMGLEGHRYSRRRG